MILTDIHFDDEPERGQTKKPDKERAKPKEAPIAFTESLERSYAKARALAATLGAPETHPEHLFAVLAREKIGRAELEARAFSPEAVFASALDVARRLPAITEDRARTDAPAASTLAALFDAARVIAQGHEKVPRPVSTGDVLNVVVNRRAGVPEAATRTHPDAHGKVRQPMAETPWRGPTSERERTPPRVIDAPYQTVDERIISLEKIATRVNERQARLTAWSRRAVAASLLAVVVSVSVAANNSAPVRQFFVWLGVANKPAVAGSLTEPLPVFVVEAGERRE